MVHIHRDVWAAAGVLGHLYRGLRFQGLWVKKIHRVLSLGFRYSSRLKVVSRRINLATDAYARRSEACCGSEANLGQIWGI
jgi:hypothetical protein